MTAPPDTRVRPLTTGDERAMLERLLDHHRETLLWKCAGLTHEELTRRLPTSALSLLGLVRHVIEVERSWFADVLGEDAPVPIYADEFGDLDAVPAESVFACFDAEIGAIRRGLAAYPLDHEFHFAGRTFTVRWFHLHMIEEYARHNGHADLLREAIDGAVGE